jgi:hypothetical protein
MIGLSDDREAFPRYSTWTHPTTCGSMRERRSHWSPGCLGRKWLKRSGESGQPLLPP